MDRRELITGGVIAAVAAASAAPASAASGQSPDPVGSYFGTVTATNPPIGQFNDLLSLHEGGVVIESRRYSVPGTPFGTLLETTGHGAWKRTGGHTFEAFFRFLLQNQDTGDPVGTDNIHLWLTGDRASGGLTGTFQSQIKDLTDTVLLTVEGTYTATPITV